MGKSNVEGRRFKYPTLSLEEALNLPVSFDLETAGRALGLGRTKSHELARAGEFPCRVMRLGNQYRVTRAELFKVLGIEAPPARQAEASSAAVEQASDSDTIATVISTRRIPPVGGARPADTEGRPEPRKGAA